MNFVKLSLLALIGISAGGVISAGVFSFITSIGIIPRIAGNTRTARYVRQFEWLIIAGGIAGGAVSIFKPGFSLGTSVAALYGLMSGIFVGCIAVAIAETLNSMAVFARRVRLKKGLRIVVYAIAIGKMAGSLVYFLKM